MSGKGSKQRPTDKKKFDTNWENIFGTNKKEKLREPIGCEHPESDKSVEREYTDLEERGLCDAEHSIQHNASSEDS